jgi:predicted amidohydrolase YtcJ
VTGKENGLWNQNPESLQIFMKLFNGKNLQVNCHCNGDEASEAFIFACKQALQEHPWGDNRHTIQHGQMVDEEQFKEIKELGMCANLFTNHIYYWGDQHAAKTIGQERAEKMNATKIALDLAIPFSMHCDASVTPIAPLFNAWSAVNRVTASGKVFREDLKISVADALYAMTMGTAYLLRLEDEIGSITVGKKADFVVLGEDPYISDPMHLKDIPVITTIFAGQVSKL